jgi:uncharacterized protein YgiM (DUF1202 family)
VKGYYLAVAFFALAIPKHVFAQQAVVQKTAPLRPNPSTVDKPEATLQAGDKLTLLDPTPEHGYYQVKTSDGKDGWVFSRSIRIIASPTASEPGVDPEGTAAAGPGGCDEKLWNHVYNPHRLIVKQRCIAVTGTIVDASNGKSSDGVRHEQDADTHGWLKVDSEFESLLNPGNMSNEGGNLVFEIVCKYTPPKQADAKPACASYSSPIKIPAVGSHVRIVGAYVRDTNHAQWMEIHPVTKIEVINP